MLKRREAAAGRSRAAAAAFLPAVVLLAAASLPGPAGAGAAAIPASGAVNVLDSGAIGDCVHDDSAAINRVIGRLENPMDTAPAASHTGAVYFPKPPGGCYLVLAPIRLLGPRFGDGNVNFVITLLGDGRGVSVIRAGAPIDAVLEKDGAWNRGDTVSDLTFDANALASHAIHWKGGAEVRFTRIEGLNGTVDDLRLGGQGEDFFSDSMFMNFTTFPLYNVYVEASSTDNEFTNNVAANASIANIREDSGGTNHFISNHGYGWPESLCPQYGFVAAYQSIWTGNQSDCSTEAGFLVTSWSTTVVGNIIQGAMNHGICLSPAGGGNTIVGNMTVFAHRNGAVNDNVPPANAVVQGIVSDGAVSCAGPGIRTAVWATAANSGTGNVVINNTPTSNENLWNALYTDGQQSPSIGIGTAKPAARLDVDGDIRVGDGASACDIARAGAIRFDRAVAMFFGCNGSRWVSFAAGK
jgi:Pectate lyase superfamily protein